MTNADLDGIEAVRSSPVRVWDAPVRCFHWVVVCLVPLSWFTAENGWIKWHLWSGSLLLTLLIFRVIWGVIGSTTARFSHFVTRPRIAIGYLKSLIGDEKPAYAGHNPAGGWMVAVLLSVLGLQIATGLFANDDVHFNGPLAVLVSKEMSDRLTELHGALFKVVLLLIWIHVTAVCFYLFVKGENLIRPMFTGKKDRAHVPPGLNLRFTNPVVALLLWALSAGIVWAIVRIS